MDTCTSNGRKSVQVLAVDDYAPMADYLAKALCEKEYSAIPVYSAEEALHTAEQFSPQALIADVMMPGMNGAELACPFAEKFPTGRSVLMTANQLMKEISIGGMRIKVFQKPFPLEELFEFLASIPL
jgi:DNA-binding response OmpR family regulator